MGQIHSQDRATSKEMSRSRKTSRAISISHGCAKWRWYTVGLEKAINDDDEKASCKFAQLMVTVRGQVSARGLFSAAAFIYDQGSVHLFAHCICMFDMRENFDAN